MDWTEASNFLVAAASQYIACDSHIQWSCTRMQLAMLGKGDTAHTLQQRTPIIVLEVAGARM